MRMYTIHIVLITYVCIQYNSNYICIYTILITHVREQYLYMYTIVLITCVCTQYICTYAIDYMNTICIKYVVFFFNIYNTYAHMQLIT